MNFLDYLLIFGALIIGLNGFRWVVGNIIRDMNPNVTHFTEANTVLGLAVGAAQFVIALYLLSLVNF